jgi:hypothetical protein
MPHSGFFGYSYGRVKNALRLTYRSVIMRWTNSGVFADLLTMLDQLKHSLAKIRFPLFAQLIYPVLEREIEAENLQAILVMLQDTELLDRYTAMQKTSKIALINRYLQHDPNNREALIQKAAFQADILSFSLHELPQGVIVFTGRFFGETPW